MHPSGPALRTMQRRGLTGESLPTRRLDTRRFFAHLTDFQSTPHGPFAGNHRSHYFVGDGRVRGPGHRCSCTRRFRILSTNLRLWKAKSPLALLICSGKETAKADWDLKIAYYARYFSLDEAARATFSEDHDKWFGSSNRSAGWVRPPFLVNKPRASLVPIKSALRYFDRN